MKKFHFHKKIFVKSLILFPFGFVILNIGLNGVPDSAREFRVTALLIMLGVILALFLGFRREK